MSGHRRVKDLSYDDDDYDDYEEEEGAEEQSQGGFLLHNSLHKTLY